ncbi:MAG: carbon-nitrogen hydrolase family protein [Maricaulaceae bacterium]|jgi:predicted amidohydrolase/ribosomal protein S18 acetylase RimI-like enzyme
MTKRRSPAKLIVRNARNEDADDIIALHARVYPDEPEYTRGMVMGHISRFAEGQFVVEREGRVVGHAATFIIDEATAFGPHTWDEICGAGYASRHDPRGDWLYGMEVVVDRSERRLRIGERLYDARKRLCEEWQLKGIVFGGRLPGFARRKKIYPTPEEYLRAVVDQEIKDPVAGFQIRQGFEPAGVLHGYAPSDKASGGAAALMVWRNPYYESEVAGAPASRRDPETVRVACVQFQHRMVKSVDEFFAEIEYFVDVTADYRCDFVVFPEMLTLQLIAFEENKLGPAEAIEALTRHTPRYVSEMSAMALRYNINIVAGSHPTRTEDGDIQNVAYVCLRDGSVHIQEKIHPTPDERYWWNIKGGDSIHAIPTDCGPVGVLICYDAEFPELARRLSDEGARVIFTPYSTDTRQGHNRVRYCAHARAIENQCYVVTAGSVGNLPNVENMDISYARSAVITPCDFPFARDGVAAEASENVETVIFADLNLADLAWARAEGSVTNLKDRRFDLYKVTFKDGV